MEWEITAYNGTKYMYSCHLETAIRLFLADNNLSVLDIKMIVNLH